MSRVAKNPISVPAGVEVKLEAGVISIKGPLGLLSQVLTDKCHVDYADGALQVAAAGESRESHAMSGTMRALLANMVTGVTKGFERKLNLVGVGYRAQAQGDKLNLSSGLLASRRAHHAGRREGGNADADRGRDPGHGQTGGRPGRRRRARVSSPSPTRARVCVMPAKSWRSKRPRRNNLESLEPMGQENPASAQGAQNPRQNRGAGAIRLCVNRSNTHIYAQLIDATGRVC
jgi:hypothetical protein